MYQVNSGSFYRHFILPPYRLEDLNDTMHWIRYWDNVKVFAAPNKVGTFTCRKIIGATRPMFYREGGYIPASVKYGLGYSDEFTVLFREKDIIPESSNRLTLAFNLADPFQSYWVKKKAN